MPDLKELRHQLHAAGNALQVIEVFIKECDPALFDPGMRKLHEAALRSIEKTKAAFEASYSTVCALDAGSS